MSVMMFLLMLVFLGLLAVAVAAVVGYAGGNGERP